MSRTINRRKAVRGVLNVTLAVSVIIAALGGVWLAQMMETNREVVDAEITENPDGEGYIAFYKVKVVMESGSGFGTTEDGLDSPLPGAREADPKPQYHWVAMPEVYDTREQAQDALAKQQQTVENPGPRQAAISLVSFLGGSALAMFSYTRLNEQEDPTDE